jgi:hypothetical protein
VLHYLNNWTLRRLFLTNDLILISCKNNDNDTFSVFFKKSWTVNNFRNYFSKKTNITRKFTFLFDHALIFKTSNRTFFFINYYFHFQNMSYRNFFSNFICKKFILSFNFNYFSFFQNYNFLNNYNFLIFTFFPVYNKNYSFFKKLNKSLLLKTSINLLFNFNVKFI